MKKYILLVGIFTILTNTNAYAIETNASDYNVITTAETTIANNENVIAELGDYKIIQINNKYYSILNKDGDYIATKDWINFQVISEDLKIIKLTKEDKFICFNASTGDLLMYPASDFTLLDNYLKIYKDGKYGLIDTYGNQILDTVYERIGLTNFNNKDYIVAKQNGKNNLYYETGDIVPEQDLYDTSDDSSLALLAKNIKSIFKTNYIKYTKNNKKNEEVINKIEELNVVKNELNDSPIKIRNKNYHLTNDENKIGLRSYDNKIILPAKFDKISIKNLSGKLSTPILLAEKDETKHIYNISGKLIAESIDNRINVYKYGRTYTYANGDLLLNGEKIGKLTQINDKLVLDKSKRVLLPTNKVNELILIILQN